MPGLHCDANVHIILYHIQMSSCNQFPSIANPFPELAKFQDTNSMALPSHIPMFTDLGMLLHTAKIRTKSAMRMSRNEAVISIVTRIDPVRSAILSVHVQSSRIANGADPPRAQASFKSILPRIEQLQYLPLEPIPFSHVCAHFCHITLPRFLWENHLARIITSRNEGWPARSLGRLREV
jgi:hypothetical protein